MEPRHEEVAVALLTAAVSAATTTTPRDVGFACVACTGVLRVPITLHCGHTRCRTCCGDVCPACGVRPELTAEPETNIVVRGLVEKWWALDVQAAELREEGVRLFDEKRFQEAVDKYDEALARAPHDHLLLSHRSRALRRLNHSQAALSDADLVVKLRPSWAKGHLRRAAALLSLQRFDEALMALCVSAALDNDPSKVQSKVELALRHFDIIAGWSTMSDVQIRALAETVMSEVRRTMALPDSSPMVPDPRLVDKADLDCILCCRMLWRPVTTPCGHTYCWACLDRCLDYSSACPLCMTSLNNYLCTSGRTTTSFIERVLTTLLPGAYADRAATHREDWASLGPHIPLFVCTTSFPCVPCPLFVYEPRYRNMVRRCVASNSGRFGMVACLSREPGAKRYAEYGTMQEIKDCVLMADGCSLVTTVGRRRFRVVTRGEKDGYDTAQVEMLRDQPILPDQMRGISVLHARVRDKSVRWFYSTNREVQAEIARTFGHCPDVEADWANCDGPAWTWWLLSILPLGPRLQVSILSTTNLEKRLRAIDKTLDHIQRCRPVPFVRQVPDDQPMDTARQEEATEGFQQTSSLGARSGCYL